MLHYLADKEKNVLIPYLHTIFRNNFVHRVLFALFFKDILIV